MATNARTMTRTGGRSATFRRFMLLVQANFLMYIRNKAAMFWVVLFPIGLMLIFGAIYGNQTIGPESSGLTLISFITPGLIVLSIMSNGLVGNAGAMANFREKGILRRVQTTPLPVAHLILSRVVMQSCIMIGQAALMLATSVVVFNARYDVAGLLSALPWIVLGSVVFMAMGQAVAALVRKEETVSVVTQVINFPLMFLGGLWMPVTSMPDWLQGVSKFLPSTMLADLVRTPMLSSFHIEPTIPFAMALLGITAYLVGSVALSARFFKWS
ncbi:MAG: ABC transporter permease [Chloroflexota bacterium]